MAIKSANTLKGKILLATSVMAFFICTFGLISYLVVSLLINDAFYGVFIPFLFLGFAVMVFGGWLSNEVAGPIEKVTLLAKSIERGASNSMPKTTGSYETDQLLQTLHRNSQQTQKIVMLMDKVTSGEIDIALTSLQESDRLTTSFQKLLIKFSEAIHAKEDLAKLQDSLNQIKREIATVRNGNLDVEIKSDFFQTKEITETFKYLIEHLNQIISQFKQDSQNTQTSASTVEKTMSRIIQQDENRILEMNQASIVLKQVPNLIRKISNDLSTSANSAKQSIEKAKLGNIIAHENSNAVGKVRKQMREAARGIQGLNERSQEISKVAKTVEDLAHRTNMIALNASIQATEIGGQGHGFALVAEEFEKLAARADGTNRQISTLNKSIAAEIGKVESSLEATSAEVSNLSRFAIETANILSELERYVGQFLNLQENLILHSQQQSDETDGAFQTFVKSIGETEITVSDLKDSAVSIKNLSDIMRNLQLMISEYRLLSDEAEEFQHEEPEFINFTQEKEQNPIRDTKEELTHTEESNGNYEEFKVQDFAFEDSVSFEYENKTQNPDDEELEELTNNESVEEELDFIEPIPVSVNSAENTEFDDLQIEATKVSYDTAELSLDFDKSSHIPTYEEI